MSRPPVNLARKIKDIVQHAQPLPNEATVPIRHYASTTTDIWSTLAYVEKKFGQTGSYPGVVDKHLGRLYGIALVNLVETFERFLKEVAAECVDCLAGFVIDDRFNVFPVQGSSLASHFGTGTLGKSLCESSTWLDCEEINKRFRRLLAEPFQVGGQLFDLFPKQPSAELARFETMSLIWQIRHTSVHNVGVITQSDAVKMRLWAKEHVTAPRILTPTRKDLRYLKRFLDGSVDSCNERIGKRLAELLTGILTSTPSLFDAQEMANRLATTFRLPLQVAGVTGIIPRE